MLRHDHKVRAGCSMHRMPCPRPKARVSEKEVLLGPWKGQCVQHWHSSACPGHLPWAHGCLQKFWEDIICLSGPYRIEGETPVHPLVLSTKSRHHSALQISSNYNLVSMPLPQKKKNKNENKKLVKKNTIPLQRQFICSIHLHKISSLQLCFFITWSCS